ncbi:MAG: hypothetical protein PHX87_03725 [Candidatus Peribacteraceae bacterium]|nr:hypothetical protein [Candidatus Peribacteraceae bacterium]MDD5742514.1 hypothetical protein [Candidatus Peribacteraceae bacterium]
MENASSNIPLEVHVGALTHFPHLQTITESIRRGTLRVIAFDPAYVHWPQNNYQGIELVPKSGEWTGLDTSSTNDVWLLNVLNDAVKKSSSGKWLPKVERNEISEALFREAVRIVKPTGVIHVGADNTPEEFPYWKVEAMAYRYHLRCETLVHCIVGKPTTEQIALYKQLTDRDWRPPYHDYAYFVELRKEAVDSDSFPTPATVSR